MKAKAPTRTRPLYAVTRPFRVNFPSSSSFNFPLLVLIDPQRPSFLVVLPFWFEALPKNCAPLYVIASVLRLGQKYACKDADVFGGRLLLIVTSSFASEEVR